MLRSFFCVSSSTVPLRVKVPIRSSYMCAARVRSTPENFTLAAMVASRSWRMKRSALTAARIKPATCLGCSLIKRSDVASVPHEFFTSLPKKNSSLIPALTPI